MGSVGGPAHTQDTVGAADAHRAATSDRRVALRLGIGDGLELAGADGGCPVQVDRAVTAAKLLGRIGDTAVESLAADLAGKIEIGKRDEHRLDRLRPGGRGGGPRVRRPAATAAAARLVERTNIIHSCVGPEGRPVTISDLPGGAEGKLPSGRPLNPVSPVCSARALLFRPCCPSLRQSPLLFDEAHPPLDESLHRRA